jgi:hypothetical protein
MNLRRSNQHTLSHLKSFSENYYQEVNIAVCEDRVSLTIAPKLQPWEFLYPLRINRPYNQIPGSRGSSLEPKKWLTHEKDTLKSLNLKKFIS